MEELFEWLKNNKIQYNPVDDDVIEIVGMGLVFVQDMDKVKSILKQDKEGEYVFNCTEDIQALIDEEIFYAIFKFGDNWYYFDIRNGFELNILKYVGTRFPCAHQTKFVNIGVHTPYELLNGSFMPKSWITKAKYLGHDALGICDTNTMAAMFMFQKECSAAGIAPVFGYSLTFAYGEEKVDGKVYVLSQKGLRNLLRIQKAIMVDSEDKLIGFDELINRGEGNVFVFGKNSSRFMIDYPEAVNRLESVFSKVYYQVDLAEYKAERIDVKVLESTKLYFDNLYGKVTPILIGDCYYLDRDDAKNKIILNKIAEGAAHEQSDDQYFKDIDEHYATFERLFDAEKWNIQEIFEECCKGTVFIAENSKARFETERNFMPEYDMTSEEKEKYGTPHNMFCQLLEEGLQRLAPADKIGEYRKQMEYEKYIIESTNNVDYLLVQYDTVNWCRRNGILIGCGRGSAAGSLLLYLLGITLIDPIKFHLIFERFLLPERAGLYPADTTIIAEPIDSTEYLEVELENGKTLNIDKDAELMVRREGVENPIRIYADQLQDGDDILFDNKDVIFTIKEL